MSSLAAPASSWQGAGHFWGAKEYPEISRGLLEQARALRPKILLVEARGAAEENQRKQNGGHPSGASHDSASFSPSPWLHRPG